MNSKKSTKKSELDLSVGSKFLVTVDKGAFPIQAEVLSRKGEDIEVGISTPARPKICGQCGHGRNLSVNGATGVVVCMTTGCGRDFGYSKKAKKVTMKISDFKTNKTK